jgi:hypothetical protein
MSANGRENVRMELYGQAVRRFSEVAGALRLKIMSWYDEL